MVELKLYVSEIDFEAVLRLFAGSGAVGGVAAMAARAMSDTAREELAVKYLNANADKLENMLQTAIEDKGVHLKVSGAQASVVRP